ncbi:MAG: hypothetical protein R3E53_10990 [Myxococcota bacterium]
MPAPPPQVFEQAMPPMAEMRLRLRRAHACAGLANTAARMPTAALADEILEPGPGPGAR